MCMGKRSACYKELRLTTRLHAKWEDKARWVVHKGAGRKPGQGRVAASLYITLTAQCGALQPVHGARCTAYTIPIAQQGITARALRHFNSWLALAHPAAFHCAPIGPQELREVQRLRDLPKLIILDLSGNPCTGMTTHAPSPAVVGSMSASVAAAALAAVNDDYRLYTIYNVRKLKVLDGVPIEAAEQVRKGQGFKSKHASHLTCDYIEREESTALHDSPCPLHTQHIRFWSPAQAAAKSKYMGRLTCDFLRDSLCPPSPPPCATSPFPPLLRPASQAAAKSKYSGRLTRDFLHERFHHAMFDRVRDLDCSGLKIRDVGVVFLAEEFEFLQVRSGGEGRGLCGYSAARCEGCQRQQHSPRQLDVR